MPFTKVELEQIRNARVYDDTLIPSPLAESGVDHSNDFDYVISQIKQIMGTANWFDTPPAKLSQIASVSGFWVTENELAQALIALSGQMIGAETWTDVFENGAGILQASGYNAEIKLGAGKTWSIKDSTDAIIQKISDTENTALRFGKRAVYIAGAQISADTEIVIPGGLSYTLGDAQYRNLMVFRDGVLQLPGSDANNDYIEFSATGVKFNFNIRKHDILTFRIFA
jgi:hypothetical protein